MNRSIPHTAMVLAAGYGKRMLPLTAHTPKPLLRVGGVTMLDHVLNKIKAEGIENIIVNAGHLGEQIIAHCHQRTDLNIITSYEAEPLETGGGVKQALPLLGQDPIFVINADLPWQENGVPALQRLREQWQPQQMDMLLLVAPLAVAQGFGGKGDYALLLDGQLRRLDGNDLAHVYIGAQIVKPQLYAPISERIFSNLMLFDEAEKAGRLYGCVHEGTCYHVGTPEDLTRANNLLESGQGWGGKPR